MISGNASYVFFVLQTGYRGVSVFYYLLSYVYTLHKSLQIVTQVNITIYPCNRFWLVIFVDIIICSIIMICSVDYVDYMEFLYDCFKNRGGMRRTWVPD